MTRVERLAEREAKAQHKFLEQQTKLREARSERQEEERRLQAKQRAHDKRLHTQRQLRVGQAADAAGLLTLSDTELTALFALLTPFLALPHPVTILEGLLEDAVAYAGETTSRPGVQGR